MKLRLTLLSIFALAGFSSAATISVANYNGASTFALVGDSSSALLTSGSVTLGTYTTEPLVLANVLTNFTALGAPIAFFGGAAPGYFTGSVSGAISAGSFFDGKTVYAIIGNGATTASSTQFAVWKSTSNPAGNIFTPDTPIGGPSDVQVLTGTGSLLIGTVQNYNVPGFGSQPGITLAAVPEPSAAILGALGLLGLIRRRRN